MTVCYQEQDKTAVSGSLSAHHQEFLAYIGIGTFYAVFMTVCYQEQDGTAVSGSKQS
jgi:hypothetical protein